MTQSLPSSPAKTSNDPNPDDSNELSESFSHQHQINLDTLENGRKPIKIPYDSHLKVLAPMVRVNKLPFRRMCQKYGADVVFSEELIDRALLGCTRHVNKEKGIVEYLDKRGEPVFQSQPEERNLVLQIGTPSAEYALKVAQHVYQDYDAIDLNCGCPKNFSVKGKMGVALLRPDSRERLKDILSTLVRNLDKPVTCKVRLLDTMSETLDLIKMIQSTGVSAITVHARYIDQRPREPALLDELQHVKEVAEVPIIANGDCFAYTDVEKILAQTKCDSVMIARGALYNASVFGPEVVPPCEIAKEWIQSAQQYGEKLAHFKYSIRRMFEQQTKKYPFNALANTIKTWQECEEVFDNWEFKMQTNAPDDRPTKKQRMS